MAVSNREEGRRECHPVEVTVQSRRKGGLCGRGHAVHG